MDKKSLQALILSEKKQRDTVILAHTYQAPEIIDIADFAGDSYALSVHAQKCEAKRIIICGVRFMAETVKILSPEKTIILPVAQATCPMAENITPQQVRDFKEKNPQACVLVMTSPPSVLHRKYKNTFIEKYAEIIEDNAHVKNYAVWNLLDVFGGNKSIKRNAAKGYMARDKVHYSKAGYEKQGELFFEAFLQSYELFKSTKQ